MCLVRLGDALSALCLEIADDGAVLPPEGRCELAERCDWAVLADCDDPEGGRDDELLG